MFRMRPFWHSVLTILTLVMTGHCLGPRAAQADTWHAQWIGIETKPLEALSLSESSWIWHPAAGADLTKAAPVGKRFFRRRIDLQTDMTIVSALAAFCADNEFTLFVNGAQVDHNSDWRSPHGVEISKQLKAGANEIAVEAYNAPGGSVNAAGLLGSIVIRPVSGGPIEYRTDGAWKSSDTALTGWKLVSFDDSAWSAPSVIGASGIAPWGVVEIPKSEASQKNTWTCFRKSFILEEHPSHAVARIAVDSKYWLWINGKLAVFEGGLKRGPTPEDTYFDRIDVTRYLHQGSNTVAILAWYFGKEGFSHKSSGKAGLLFELSSGKQTIDSDSSWKAVRNPAYGQADGPEPNFRIAESPIRYDARNDIGPWTAEAFDDSSWSKTVVFGAPPIAPWHALWLRPVPQWKYSELRPYLKLANQTTPSGESIISAALPYNCQVTPWLRINSPAGKIITIRTDDALNEIYDQYVTKEGVQEFEGLAWMNGHHVVYTIPAGVRILGLKYRESGFNTELSGSFQSDDPTLDRLWIKAQRTLYVTMRDNYMDCPDRERGQWIGDEVNEIGESFYGLSPSSSTLAAKGISNLTQWQRPDHTLFAPIPAGNWSSELPQQILASVGFYGCWTYYLNTGDLETISAAYPHVRSYLAIWKRDNEGLIVHRAGDWDWCDWGDNIDVRVLDNAWFCLALDGAAKMAMALKLPEEAKLYREERLSLIAAVNSHFWNGNCYRDPAYKGDTDDRANALAVVAGIADASKFDNISAVLAASYHASPYMEKYVLEALMLMDRPDQAIERMHKRFDKIVATKLTTLPEEWDGGTDNHAWSGGALTILSQYVTGITPTRPGWSSFSVRPSLGSLTHVRSVVDTHLGKIVVDVQRRPSAFQIHLSAPQGTVATVAIPNDTWTESVVVNGRLVWTVNSGAVSSGSPAKYLSTLSNRILLQVPAGSWLISSKGPSVIPQKTPGN